jgi:S-adenosylmethionine decarboxylase proenzyme
MEQRNGDKIELGSTSLGKHLLLDFFHCKMDGLDNVFIVKDLICKVAEVLGATVVSNNFHHFTPLGVSGVLIITESHITIHTWPEYDFAAIDIFYCGKLNIEAGIQLLKALLQTENVTIQEFHRGDHFARF